MPKRHDVPPVLRGRHPSLIAHFLRDYEQAAAYEKALPPEQRTVSRIGPAYAAMGWLLCRDISRGRKPGD